MLAYHDITPANLECTMQSLAFQSFESDYIRVNAAKGRLKDKNMRKRPVVTLCIQDTSDPSRYLQVRGRVSEITEVGANPQIDAMAGKYIGNFKYQYHQPGMKQIIYNIIPEKVDPYG